MRHRVQPGWSTDLDTLDETFHTESFTPARNVARAQRLRVLALKADRPCVPQKRNRDPTMESWLLV